jgi:hypothetical protein
MGGNIAGIYAARYKNDIHVLWLIAPGGIISPQPSELSQMLTSGDRNPLVAENEEEYDQLLDFVFVKRPTIPGSIKRYLVEEAINHRPLNQIIFNQITSTDTNNFVPLEILLKDNQINTLILWGEKDRVLHVSAAKKLESVMPNAKSVIMKDVGHVPMVEKPEDSAKTSLSPTFTWAKQRSDLTTSAIVCMPAVFIILFHSLASPPWIVANCSSVIPVAPFNSSFASSVSIMSSYYDIFISSLLASTSPADIFMTGILFIFAPAMIISRLAAASASAESHSTRETDTISPGLRGVPSKGFAWQEYISRSW